MLQDDQEGEEDGDAEVWPGRIAKELRLHDPLLAVPGAPCVCVGSQ